MAPDFSFLLAFEASSARMATDLVRALEQFHPGCAIRVLTTLTDVARLRAWADQFHGVEIAPYRAPLALAHGHPLAWAKLEAFADEGAGTQVVLDVDQVVAAPLTAQVAAARASGRAIAASPELADLRSHVRDSFTGAPLEALVGVPCFHAGAMIVRPSRSTYRALLELAERHAAELRMPAQAILNLWARASGGHHDLGELFLLSPWSPRAPARRSAHSFSERHCAFGAP